MWCPVLGGLLVIVIFPGHARKTVVVPRYDCDRDHHTFTSEGNQGPVGMFPWLGVIRVTLNEGSKLRIAVTGAVLVRITFAIADAQDISKIPSKILREHSKAMFMASDDKPWLYAIRGHETAPDFRVNTISSIALVELELKDDPTPLKPICWQDRYHNLLSHKHYAVGFTDERYVLEKIAYDMMFINKSQCEIYYENLDAHATKYVPANYECWAAMNNTRNCIWENGMILVTNYTSTWFLIGIGIRGPGCSLPVRFISVLPYVEWIESVINKAFTRMRSDKIKPRVKELPAHAFYASEHELETEETRVFDGIPFRRAYNPQRKDVPNRNASGIKPGPGGSGQGSGTRGSAYRRLYEPPDDSVTDPPVVTAENGSAARYKDEHWQRDDIRHMDPNVIQFKKFGDMYERSPGDCTKVKHLVYKEIAQIVKTPNVIGHAHYKLSLIDLEIYRYTCVVLRVKSRTRSDCNLWYSISKAMDEPLALVDDTPGEILKGFIPAGERVTTGPFEMDANYWEPHQNLEVFYKKDEDAWTPRWWTNSTMFNLYLRFDFVDDAELILEVWSPSSEMLYQVSATEKINLRRTRTRKKGHKATRPTRPWTWPPIKRTRTKPKHLLRTRTQSSDGDELGLEVEDNNNRREKATIKKTGNLTAKLGLNGSDYVESCFCLIVILLICTIL